MTGPNDAFRDRRRTPGERSHGPFEVATGHLEVADSTVRIGPTLTRRALEASPLFAAAEDFVGGEPDRSWKISGLRIGEERWCVVLRYQGERLERVELTNDDPRFGTSWDDWSTALELERNASHEAWLQAAIGDAREFTWGHVAHVKDPHYGTFSIFVRYRA